MMKKIKYIFFDFSNKFKNDFLNLFKKSILFLILGIIGYILINTEISAVGELMCGLGFLIFGLIWAHNIASSLTIAAMLPKNVMLKLVLLIAVYAVCMILGYLYFVWSLIKFIFIEVRHIYKIVNDKK